jgi:hypothetical protein
MALPATRPSRTYDTSGGFAGGRSGLVLSDQHGRLVRVERDPVALSAVLLRVLLQAVAEAPDSAGLPLVPVLLQAVAEAPDSAGLPLVPVLLQAVAEAPDSAGLPRVPVLLQAVAEAANTIWSVSRPDVVCNLAAVFPVSRRAVLDRDAIHNSSF